MKAALVDLGLVGAALTGVFALWKVAVGLFRLVSTVNKAWAVIERELQPNGGGSTYDRLCRIERLLELHITDPQAHSLKEVS